MARSMLVQYNSYSNSFEERTRGGRPWAEDREALVRKAREVKITSLKSKQDRVLRAGQKCQMSNELPGN